VRLIDEKEDLFFFFLCSQGREPLFSWFRDLLVEEEASSSFPFALPFL